MPEGKQYLVVIQLINTTPERLLKRAADIMPKIKETLRSISTEPIESAFHSVTADLFGFGLRSERDPYQIRALLESPSEHVKYGVIFKFKEPYLKRGDHIMVFRNRRK